jgi:hypothetical protein
MALWGRENQDQAEQPPRPKQRRILGNSKTRTMSTAKNHSKHELRHLLKAGRRAYCLVILKVLSAGRPRMLCLVRMPSRCLAPFYIYSSRFLGFQAAGGLHAMQKMIQCKWKACNLSLFESTRYILFTKHVVSLCLLLVVTRSKQSNNKFYQKPLDN